MKQSVYDYSYKMREARRRHIIYALTIFFSIAFFLCIVTKFLVFPVFVRSGSMEGTIPAKSAVLVTPLNREPERGELFYLSRLDEKTLNSAESFFNMISRLVTAQQFSFFYQTDATTGKESIRRVLALPGDTIYMKDYILYVKPQGEDHFLSEFELSEKPYSINFFDVPYEWDSIGSSSSMEEVVLGENEYFVLADNRILAVDSRHYGPVKQNRFLGKVILEYFPFKNFKQF